MAAVLASLTGLQREWGCGGSLVEVGVFRGASFFPLLLLSADGESVVGVDCFAGQQSANVDGSGFSASVPSVTEFQRMMEQCVPEEVIRQRASILQCDSSTLTPDALKEGLPAGARNVRIFSIDGCHTEEATFSDCVLAGSVATKPGGVIMVDDVFNPHWPGVSVGLLKFLQEDADGWKPFFIGFNKVLLCQAVSHDRYLAHVNELPSHVKQSVYAGAAVSIHRQGWLAAMYGND